MSEGTFTDLGAFISAVNERKDATEDGRRKARDYWHPALCRLYGFKPWEMGRLTLREMRLLAEDVEMLGRQ